MPGRLWRTSGFRLALGFTVLFVITAVVVGGFVYARSAALLIRQTDETIEAEIRGLAEQYADGGLRELAATVGGRSRRPGDGLYYLGVPQGRHVAGNLDRLPEVAPDASGWLDFDIQRFDATAGPDGGPAMHAARGRLFRLREGAVLLVGRDIQARRNIEAVIEQALIAGLVVTLVLGLGGGIVAGRRMLHRVDAASAAAREIMSGDLTRRLPDNGTGDELDRLSDTLNRMLDRIEQLLTAMREVTDNVAHDLRTPLTRLRARAEAALADDTGSAKAQAALSDIVDEADRLLQVFTSLLAIARIEAGSAGEHLADTDLSALVGDVAELYEPICEQHGIAFEARIASHLRAHADRQLLSQAIANLIENALNHGRPAQGSPTLSLSLSLEDGGDEVLVVVADNGPGIPAARRDDVRRRFYRLDDSRSVPGSGLGLSLVQAVAGAHGGRMSLADTMPGAAEPGLRAIVHLPAVRTAD